MPKYGQLACFSPVIKVEWVKISSTGTGTPVHKNWELENEKKKNNGVLAIQKVAKTGNIGKKSPVVGNIDYLRYLSMQN